MICANGGKANANLEDSKYSKSLEETPASGQKCFLGGSLSTLSL
jgi:hypothetical protein